MSKATSRRIMLVGSIIFMALLFPLVFGWGRSDKYLHSFWVRWLNNKVDGRIDFYGRVVDQSGSPIEGVNILIHIRKFRFSIPGTPWRVISLNLKTDTQGCFEIVRESGKGITVWEIQKQGYEAPWGAFSFNYEQNTTGIFQPDPDHPVTYRMRKKEEETFIINHEKTGCFEYDRDESGIQKGFDFIIGNSINEKDFAHPMAGYIPLTCDLRTRADYDPKTNRWKMQIFPGDPNGGILVSPEKWYVAPAEGYLPSYTVDPDIMVKEFNLASTNKPWVPSNGAAYVYLKSRTPPVYTRFSISTIRLDEDRLSVGAGGYITNPYGDRNLEPATELPWEITHKLHEEVRDCYINGRRPLKPDLSKLVLLTKTKQIK